MKTVAMINSDNKRRPPLPDPPGVTTSLVSLRLRALARTPYDRLFTDLGTVDAAETALTAGCDAIFIDTFADYGIEAIRTIAGVPVVGAGEASIAAMQAHGPFSIVTVWPASMGYIYDDRLRTCVGGDGCRGVHHFSPESELDRVGTSEGVQARMIRRESELVERLAAACREAVDHDRTGAVLLGCTCMSPIAAQLQDLCDFPVVDASATGQAATFDVLGSAPPERQSSPRVGDVASLVEAWTEFRADTPDPDECEVCLVVSDHASERP